MNFWVNYECTIINAAELLILHVLCNCKFLEAQYLPLVNPNISQHEGMILQMFLFKMMMLLVAMLQKLLSAIWINFSQG